MAKNTIKPATTTIIKFAEKQMGVILPPKSNWEEVYEVLAKDFGADMYTRYEIAKNNTTYSLYKEDNAMLHSFDWPNDLAYMGAEGDWNWNFIYKEIVTWLYQNRKQVYGKPAKQSKKAIKERMKTLLAQIKAAKGMGRTKLIEEYNELAKRVS